MTPDVRVYLVSAGAGPQLPEIAVAAAAGGATMVQVRDKYADAAVTGASVRAVAARLGRAGIQIPVLVNDDPAVAASAAGVHIGPDDLSPVQARALLGPESIIGWSIHSMDQLADTAALSACDYVAASPVWATPSKTDTTEPWGLAGVRALRESLPSGLPLVAIGGIHEDNARDIIDAGADGIAVVSAISAAKNPEKAAHRLREVVDTALAHRSVA